MNIKIVSLKYIGGIRMGGFAAENIFWTKGFNIAWKGVNGNEYETM